MGIKGLNAFLKEKCPNTFVSIPYTYFKGKRIAVDSHNVLRKLMSRAHKEVVLQTDVPTQELDRDEIIKRWVFHTKNEVVKWLSYGATLIFVFDGAYMKEKSATQEKRRAVKNKSIEKARVKKEEILSIDILDRTPAMTTDMRKLLQNLAYITSDEMEYIRGILSGIGLPCIIAESDGEQLCAMLALEGKVHVAYSRDTDLLAYGCPITINEDAGYCINPKTKESELSVKCSVFIPILKELKITYPTFLDLCIMSGCDYNSNIFRVGIKTAYKMLLSCKRIEDLPDKYSERKSILNHEFCRKIFKCVPSECCSQDKIILDVNKDLSEARDRLSVYGVNDWIVDFKSLYSKLPQPSHKYIMRKPSLARSCIRLKVKDDCSGNVVAFNNLKSSPKYNRRAIKSINSDMCRKLREKRRLRI